MSKADITRQGEPAPPYGRHTPGPWGFTPWTKTSAALIDGNGNVLAVVTPHSAAGRASWDANARLIEAAPELLKALKAAYAVIDAMHAHDDVCGALNAAGLAGYAADAHTKARDAIAKAEGR